MRSIIVLVWFFLAGGCGNSPSGFGLSKSTGKHQSTMQSPRTTQTHNPSNSNLETGSKVIRNGLMKFEVIKLNEVKADIDSIVKTFGGYYENEKYNAYQNRISYNLIIRMPSEKFDSTIVELESGIGKLVNKKISAEDVTEEYVDLNIRLNNNLAYLKQYKAILAKAKTIKEILEVQKKIRRIEEEIESKKGRLKYLDNKTSFSTLNLEITELASGDFSNKPKFGNRIVNAFNNGIRHFGNFLVFLISIWPFILGIALLYYGRKPLLNRLRKFKRKKKN